MPPTCRGVGAVESRPTAWGGARPALVNNTTTPKRRVRAARRVLHGRFADFSLGESARNARHGIQKRRRRTLECRATNLSQWWCGRAPAGSVGSSVPRVGLHHDHAKSALRGACSAGGRLTFHEAKSASDARQGNRKRLLRLLECRAANLCCVGAVEHRPTAWEAAYPCWPSDQIDHAVARVGHQSYHVVANLNLVLCGAEIALPGSVCEQFPRKLASVAEHPRMCDGIPEFRPERQGSCPEARK